MVLQAILFYSFAVTTVGATLLVISLKNPVHCVLALILAFFSSAWLFIMLGAEFIAMLLIIVYVGAVAVLFLFVVMMLDINFAVLKQGFLRYLPFGAVVAVVIFAELYMVINYSGYIFKTELIGAAPAQSPVMTNTHMLGKVLYTNYFLPFQMAGLILLLAMVGAVVLTLRHREGVRRQKISQQVARKKKDSVELVKVKVGKGV